MRIRRYIPRLLLIITALFPLGACNFGVSKPEANISPSPLSENPLIPTETMTPMASAIPTLTSTPAATPIPSLTLTLFYDATITPTPQWSTCPGITVAQTDTRKGDMLHIRRCEDGLEYDLGPLAKGVYAVGPNNRFLVYVSLNGFVFAARIGERYLTNVINLEKEHIYTVFNKKVAPDFRISFAGDGPFYTLVLLEKNYDQKRVYWLPVGITE